MKESFSDITPYGRLGEPSLPVFQSDGPEVRPYHFSQAEDSTQASGSEDRMPGTARPRVRIREHRPGFHL